MMLPVGRLTMVRTFAKSELIRAMSFVAIPGLIGPMLGPLLGGLIVGYFHWSVIFFVNIPIGIAGLVLVHRHLPNYRAAKNYPLDIVGLVLFGAGISLLSYVLEVFGEHIVERPRDRGAARDLGRLARRLRPAFGAHGASAAAARAHCAFAASACRSAAISLTRLGIGGMPFLLPLLYQVGLGFTPIQSGLMIMPQALAAMSFKFTMPLVLKRFGYRQVLIFNTVMLGLMLMLFSAIDVGTPAWLIAVLAFAFGFFTSTQYTSMNTLAFADVNSEQASGASTIASTVQQMAVSFGVATASLAAAIFIPDHTRASAPEMIHGIHVAIRVLGAWTILSTFVFVELRSGDGAAVSAHKAGMPAA